MNLIGVLKLLGITAGITAIVGLCCLASRELCSPTKRRGEVSKWGNSRTWTYRRERRPPRNQDTMLGTRSNTDTPLRPTRTPELICRLVNINTITLFQRVLLRRDD